MVTLRVRGRLDMGLLPRAMPPLTTEPGRPTSPTGHIMADTGIGVVKCAACDEAGAQGAYRFPDGRVLRFHRRCPPIWERGGQSGPRGERAQDPPSPPGPFRRAG